jgi:hypothetical protein
MTAAKPRGRAISRSNNMRESMAWVRKRAPFLMAAILGAGCMRAEPGNDKTPEKTPIADVKPVGHDNPKDPPLDEKDPLKNLERYKAKWEVDDQGDVVRVVLEGAQVTNEALDQVVKLPKLKSLSLAWSSVTDQGLEKLQNMTSLEALGITNTPVTDQGLKHLEAIPSLRYVWVCETDKLTKQGIASLRETIDGVNVYIMNEPKKKTGSN